MNTWHWSACEYMALELDELAVVDITGTGAGDVYTGAFDIS